MVADMLVEYKNMPNVMEHQGKLRVLASFFLWFDSGFCFWQLCYYHQRLQLFW